MKAFKTHCSQNGSVLVVTALSLFVIMGMAGLAIDISHAEKNKTQLQNLADSLALSAAISLNKQNDPDNSTDEENAETYARTNTFVHFKNSDGNSEIASGIVSSPDTDADDLKFEFATTLSVNSGDWHPANEINDAKFVRVAVDRMDVSTWFANVIGFDEVAVSTSAVAGPVPLQPCDVAPIMMCATLSNPDDLEEKPEVEDPDCTDNTHNKNITVGMLTEDPATDDPDCYGYELHALYCMKSIIGGTPDPRCPDPPDIKSAGNFGWLEVGGSPPLKACAAGDPDCTLNCKFPIDPDTGLPTVPTKTGEVYGQAKDGFNTRFNQYPNGGGPDALTPEKYPPDKVIGLEDSGTVKTNGDLTKVQTIGSETMLSPEIYDYYNSTTEDVPSNQDVAKKGRRILPVPFIDCREPINGKEDVKIVGFGCFLMAREYGNVSNPYVHKPNPWPANNKYLYGVFLGSDESICQGVGKTVTNVDYGYYKVILYKDPFSSHS
jgi:hypothetical protein